MRKDDSRLLEECLRLMQGGTPMEDCLRRFPDHADELRPHLVMADRLFRTQPTDPPDGAPQRGKDRLMAALNEQPKAPAAQLLGASLWLPLPLRHALAPLRRLSLPYQMAATAAALALMIGAVMGASAAGGPGSPMRSFFSPTSGSDLPSDVSTLTPTPTPTPTATADPTPEVEIKGVVESVGDGTFVVGGVTVVVTTDTRLDDFGGQPLAAGQRVEVHGVMQSDGSILATSVELDDEDAVDDDANDDDHNGDDNNATPTPVTEGDDADADEDEEDDEDLGAAEVDDDADDADDDHSTVTPTSTPDADDDDDEEDDDADDDHSTVTPTSTPDAEDDADEEDDDADDDHSTVTPTSTPDADEDADEEDDDHSTVTPTSTPDDHNGDEDDGDDD